MSKSIEQLGHSKINIGLAITGKRDDGYHNIDSIFQSIRLADSIYFAKHHSVVFSGVAPELPQYIQDLIPYDERNLALKALREVQKYTAVSYTHLPELSPYPYPYYLPNRLGRLASPKNS